MSYVLLALTACRSSAVQPLQAVPVPFDLQFSLGPFIITPTEVLTLIVAPIVTLVLVLASASRRGAVDARHVGERGLRPARGRLDPPHLHADVDGGGALSAFTAILNAPNQTSALTQALSPTCSCTR